MRLALAVAAVGAAGCGEIADLDDIYSGGREVGRVVCAISIDDRYAWGYDDIVDALDRARDDGSALQIYAHRPGVTVQMSRIEAIVGSAADRGLAFVTYPELV